MAGTISGTTTFGSGVTVNVPPGTNLANYSVSVNPSSTITWATGTGASQANKVAQVSGSAAAAAASVDLSALACVDGQTGFSHWREVIVYNDDATHTLLWDFTATNANVAMHGAGGTTDKLTIEPGEWVRFGKRNGTNGYTVDSTHKVISLDPGANTVAYRVYVIGD